MSFLATFGRVFIKIWIFPADALFKLETDIGCNNSDVYCKQLDIKNNMNIITRRIRKLIKRTNK